MGDFSNPEQLQINKQVTTTIQTHQEQITTTVQKTIPEGPVESTRQRNVQTTINREMVSNAQRTIPTVSVANTAAGIPIQEQAPAQQTWKERQRDKRHAKEARKRCPVGTATTYDMVKNLQEGDQSRINFLSVHPEVRIHGIDTRVLSEFARGHKVDKKGRPATEEDARAKALDDQYAADYISMDVERRKPHLERMVDEVLALRFDASMLTEQYLRKHAAEVKSIGDKMTCIDNVIRDPINRPFFENLDPARKAALENPALKQAHNSFIVAFTMACQKYGVDFNNRNYFGFDQEGAIQLGQQMAAQSIDLFRTDKVASDQAVAAINAAQVERVRTSAVSYGEVIRTVNPQLTAVSHEVNMVKNDRYPPADVYKRARAICTPIVQRILECDVDQLKSLTDEALLVRSAELNRLFKDATDVSQMLDLKHYRMNWGNQDPLTMKDELLGCRDLEYDYKQQMIQGLMERARGLSVLRFMQNGGEVTDAFFSQEEIEQGISDDKRAFFEEQIRKGAQTMEQASEQYRLHYTSGTAEFIDYFMKVQSRRGSQYTVPKEDLADVAKEFEESASPEIVEVLKRIKNNDYYSIAVSEETIKQSGANKTIGEAIFRSFNSFLCYEATGKMLTPQQLRQMFMDLGAGAGMHTGQWTDHETHEVTDEQGKKVEKIVEVQREGTPEVLLQPAIEANKRGLMVYKNILKAQFDMLERKYGRAIERLTMDDIMKHYTEIAKDFSDVQVTMNMTTKFPGFLDSDDPEDTLLRKRVEYYCLAGQAASSVLPLLPIGGITDDAGVAEFISSYMNDPSFAEARQWLQENREGFVRENIDWSQKVRDDFAH